MLKKQKIRQIWAVFEMEIETYWTVDREEQSDMLKNAFSWTAILKAKANWKSEFSVTKIIQQQEAIG